MRFDIDQISSDIVSGQKALLVLDGDCRLCNNLALWLSQRDKRGSFLFATLSDYKSTGVITPENTAILLTDGKIYTQSTAVAKTLQKLGGPWKLAQFFLQIIPRGIRDVMYKITATRRHNISRRLMICSYQDSSPITPRILDKNELLSLLLSLTKSGTKLILTSEMENRSHNKT